jgi:hypothetical protein
MSIIGTSAGTGSLDQTSSTVSASGRLAYRPLRSDPVLLVAESRGHGPIDFVEPGSCVATAVPPCGLTTDGDASGSWGEAVASIIERLLAMTGWQLLPWVVASCALTIVGMLTLHKGRKQRHDEYALEAVWSA